MRDQAELETADSSALGARPAQFSSPLDENRLNVIELAVPGSRYGRACRAALACTALQAIQSGGGPRGEVSNQSIVGGYDPAPPNTIIPGYQTWLDSLGFDGNGVVVSVVDGGIRTTHLDVASRMLACVPSGASPTSCTSSIDSHGTHVAAAIAGTGASGVLRNGLSCAARASRPGANIVRQVYDNFLGGGPGQMIADGMLKIYKESALSGAVLTNNSWGPTGSPQGYDIPTQQVDMVIRDANPDEAGNQQIQNVWSIMNGGGDGFGACAPSSLGSPDEAKNLFAVGSTALQTGSGAQVGQIFNVSSNSAHGNACDGRRVPSIVAPGCNTDSATAGSDTSFDFYMCGTSMASPVVTGASAVFVEKYRSRACRTPRPVRR
jgi:serine protease AprX